MSHGKLLHCTFYARQQKTRLTMKFKSTLELVGCHGNRIFTCGRKFIPRHRSSVPESSFAWAILIIWWNQITLGTTASLVRCVVTYFTKIIAQIQVALAVTHLYTMMLRCASRMESRVFHPRQSNILFLVGNSLSTLRMVFPVLFWSLANLQRYF